jgi:hypothetical protein
VRVLESLAKALMLTEAEREHLFLVGIGHRRKPTPLFKKVSRNDYNDFSTLCL